MTFGDISRVARQNQSSKRDALRAHTSDPGPIGYRLIRHHLSTWDEDAGAHCRATRFCGTLSNKRRGARWSGRKLSGVFYRTGVHFDSSFCSTCRCLSAPVRGNKNIPMPPLITAQFNLSFSTGALVSASDACRRDPFTFHGACHQSYEGHKLKVRLATFWRK
jgi:hypothetical protein